MFFFRILKKSVSDNERKKQRLFLYAHLYTALENGELSLVWPINQNIDLNNKKMKGYCHGYTVKYGQHTSWISLPGTSHFYQTLNGLR